MTQYTVRQRESDGVDCIYLADYAVVIAEFAENTRWAAREIGRLLDASPQLLAALEEIEQFTTAHLNNQSISTKGEFRNVVTALRQTARAALAAVQGEEEVE